MKRNWIKWALSITLVLSCLFLVSPVALTKEMKQEWEILNPEGVIKIEAMKVNPHPFPLFPDEDFKNHKELGEVRTPYFFVIKIKKDRALEVIYSEEGALGEAETFLQHILKTSGLK